MSERSDAMLSKFKTNFEVFFQLTKRHFLVFFKNKVRVIYTVMIPLIILVVYILFLRSMELMSVDSTIMGLNISQAAKDFLMKDPVFRTNVARLVDSWMLAGIAALTTITVSFQTNAVIVDDKEKGVNRDFVSSPLEKNVLIGSYFMFNFIVTSLICLIFLAVCFVFFAALGEFAFSFADVIMMLFSILYMAVCSTLVTVFISSFMKTFAVFSSIIAVVSTAIGFVIGAYMPLGTMPGWVQTICAFVPGTFGCALLRFAFMDKPILIIMDYIQTCPEILANFPQMKEIVETLTTSFGYKLQFFGMTATPEFNASMTVLYIIIFAALNMVFGKKLTEVSGTGRIIKKKTSEKTSEKPPEK